MQSKTNIQKSNLLNPFRSVYKDKGTCKIVRTASVTEYHRKSRISNRVARMRKNKTSLLQKDSALFEDSYCIHLVFKQNNTHISTSSQSFFFFANLRLMFTALAKNSKYDKGKHHLSSVEPCGPFSWSSIFHKNPDHHVVIKDYQSRLCGHVDGGTHPKSFVAELKCFLKSHSIHSFTFFTVYWEHIHLSNDTMNLICPWQTLNRNKTSIDGLHLITLDTPVIHNMDSVPQTRVEVSSSLQCCNAVFVCKESTEMAKRKPATVGI